MGNKVTNISISTWKNNSKIAFIWGIDEIGNIGNKKKIDFTDWGLHFNNKNSFLQKTFFPIIEKYPKIKFTIGAWLGDYDGVTEYNNLKEGTLSYKLFTKKWKKWMQDTIKPISKHNQIELLAHGLGHEDWIALSEKERRKRIRKIKEIFEKHLNKKCYGFNTWPYGTIIRNSLPGFFYDHDLFVTGILTTTDMNLIKKLQIELHKFRTGKRYTDVPNTTKEIGQKVKQSNDFSTQIGEMSYWKKNDKKIIALPYSSTINNLKTKVITLIKNYKSFDAPAFYAFSHLRGTSPEKKEKSGRKGGIEGNLAKFEKILNWLSMQNHIWCTTLGKAAQYFDFRKSGKVKQIKNANHESHFIFDTTDCFKWEKEIEITFKIKTKRRIANITSYKKEDNKKKKNSFKHKGEVAFVNIPIKSKYKNYVIIEYKRGD